MGQMEEKVSRVGYLKGENSIKMLWRKQRMALEGIYGFPVVS